MKILLIIFIWLTLIACNQSYEQAKEITTDGFTTNEVFEQDSLLYYINLPVTGKVVELDSMGRVVKEMQYEKGIKHGQELHFEYFETEVAVVVLEGNWKKGQKVGIWKSNDGEGKITVIKNYNKTK